MSSKNTKVLQQSINRSQLYDLLAMHLHALGIAPKKEITIISIDGLPLTEMIKVRYQQTEVSRPETSGAQTETNAAMAS